MKISVATVSLNAEATIAYTIKSFLQQRYIDKELLVVDGASSDRTVDVARSFNSEQIRIVSERDNGLYDAMNKALTAFSGDAIGFLGADDTFHSPSALGHIAAALATNDIVYGSLHMVRDHLQKRIVRV